MDRRSFLRRLGIGTAAAVVAPQGLVEALAPAHVPGTFVPLQGGTLDVETVTSNGFTMVAESFDGIVASGGVCAPMSVTYDFFQLARPVEGSLPTVRAPRGGISYIRR